jgi:hypothetical protein
VRQVARDHQDGGRAVPHRRCDAQRDALVEAITRLAVDDDVRAGLARGGCQHRIGTHEVDAVAPRPVGQDRHGVEQHPQHELLALLGIQRLAEASLAAGHRAHRQHDVDRLQVGVRACRTRVAHRMEW